MNSLARKDREKEREETTILLYVFKNLYLQFLKVFFFIDNLGRVEETLENLTEWNYNFKLIGKVTPWHHMEDKKSTTYLDAHLF